VEVTRRLATLAATIAIVGAVASTALAAIPVEPRTWIDAPLPGAILEVGPITLTIHSASPAGVAKVRVFVDSAVAAELPGGPGEIVTVEWKWPAPTLGVHILTAVGMAVDGMVSQPASAVVTVVAPGLIPTPMPRFTPAPSPSPAPGESAPGPSPLASATAAPSRTSAPTPTPTPGATPTPTRTPQATLAPPPCTPPAPQLLIPANGSGVDEPVTFEWSIDSPSCQPTGFRIQISDSRTFDTIVQQATLAADTTFWTADPGLTACTTYSWRVQAKGPTGAWGPASSAWTFYVRSRTCP
jgi:hypothetical protein